MLDFLNNIEGFLTGGSANSIYWGLAIGCTGLFILMGILALFGFGGVSDADVDVDGDGIGDHIGDGYADFRLVSVRSILAFLAMFGWGGVVFGEYGWLGFLLALICGFAMMFVASLLFYFMMRMQQSGNINRNEFIGKSGVVYMNIPGGRSNPGKITVTLDASTHELSAVADEEIPRGSPVLIKEIIGDRNFLVEKQ